MPARDSIHDAVVNALLKDGWHITQDPLMYRYGERRVFIDLGAEQDDAFVGFTRDGIRIAVEIKSFLNESSLTSLEHAIGQYVLYNLILQEFDPSRYLFVAIPETVFDTFFTEPLAELVIERLPLRLIVVDTSAQEIVQWIALDMPTS